MLQQKTCATGKLQGTALKVMTEGRSSRDPGESKTWIDKISQIFSAEPKNQEDLVELLRVARQNEVIDGEAQSIIEGALDVQDKQVREVMIPRTQMVTIGIKDDPERYMKTIIESAHSRFPVMDDEGEEVLGIMLAKDLLPCALGKNIHDLNIEEIMRPVKFIPESKRLNNLLREFREARNHMGIVLDEYGNISGLVTIEDVLEEIVGEIEDEHDFSDESFIKQLGDNDFILKALTPIDEFNDFFKAKFSQEEFDTIGGIVMQEFGRLPKRNEETMIDKFKFRVLHADRRKLHLLRMSMEES